MQDERIWCKPSTPAKGNTTEIGYKGLLAKSGADRVFLHCGKDGWHNPTTVEMHKKADGSFACTISPDGDRCIDLCFKDSAGHWDNNSGRDWHLPLSRK